MFEANLTHCPPCSASRAWTGLDFGRPPHRAPRGSLGGPEISQVFGCGSDDAVTGLWCQQTMSFRWCRSVLRRDMHTRSNRLLPRSKHTAHGDLRVSITESVMSSSINDCAACATNYCATVIDPSFISTRLYYSYYDLATTITILVALPTSKS